MSSKIYYRQVSAQCFELSGYGKFMSSYSSANSRDFGQRQNRSSAKSLCDVAESTADEDAGSLVDWEVVRG